MAYGLFIRFVFSFFSLMFVFAVGSEFLVQTIYSRSPRLQKNNARKARRRVIKRKKKKAGNSRRRNSRVPVLKNESSCNLELKPEVKQDTKKEAKSNIASEIKPGDVSSINTDKVAPSEKPLSADEILRDQVAHFVSHEQDLVNYFGDRVEIMFPLFESIKEKLLQLPPIEISKEKSNLTIITINQLTLELKQYLKLLIERVNKIKGDDFVFKVISKYAYQKEKRKNIVLNMLDKKFWGYLAQENNVLIEIIMGLVEKERIA